MNMNAISFSQLTPSQQFTKDHAQLPAKEYIFARLGFSEQQSAKTDQTGQGFSVEFEGKTFNLTAKNIGTMPLQAMETPPSFQFAQENSLSRDVQSTLLHIQEAETRKE